MKDVQGVSIHAGFPNPAAEQVLDNPDFNRLLIRHPASTFCMRLAGNDWQDQGIFAGDIVVVDRALDPKKTDLVVWVKENEFVVSKLGKMTEAGTFWGTVTSIIHQTRP